MTDADARALIARLESAFGRAEEAGTVDAERCERDLATARAEMLAALMAIKASSSEIELFAVLFRVGKFGGYELAYNDIFNKREDAEKAIESTIGASDCRLARVLVNEPSDT